MNVTEPFWQRHRGPYRLQVTRPFVTKPGFWHSACLSGELDGPDVFDEMNALLTDPRDTIVWVGVWSDREEQFVFAKGKNGSRAAKT